MRRRAEPGRCWERRGGSHISLQPSGDPSRARGEPGVCFSPLHGFLPNTSHEPFNPIKTSPPPRMTHLPPPGANLTDPPRVLTVPSSYSTHTPAPTSTATSSTAPTKPRSVSGVCALLLSEELCQPVSAQPCLPGTSPAFLPLTCHLLAFH